MAKWPGTNIEFSPGVYIITGANDSASTIINTFDQRVRDNPYVKGIVVKQKWGYATGNQPAMETSQGVYDFTLLQSVLDHVGQYPGKYVVFWPSYKLFTAAGSETPAIVPAYLRTAAYNGGAYTNTSGTSTARIWRQDVCDQWCRVLEDWGTEFGDNPVLNSIHSSETAPGSGATGQSDFPSGNGYADRIIQIVQTMAESFPLAAASSTPNFTVDIDYVMDNTQISPWYAGIGCPDSIPFKSSLVPIHDAIRNRTGVVITGPHIEFGNTGQAIQYPTNYPLYSQYPNSHIPDVYECLYYCGYYLKGNYIFLQLSQENGQTASSMITAVNQLGDAGIIPYIPNITDANGFVAGEIDENTGSITKAISGGDYTELEFVGKVYTSAPQPPAPSLQLSVNGRYFEVEE